jgi:Zinc carboxypeptidase
MFEYIDQILKCPPIIPNQVIGYSRQNRPIHATAVGKGNINISLIGGCHADEPVGPRFLRKFYGFLNSLDLSHPLLTHYSWWLIPHANPDGEAVNKKWYSDKDEMFDLVPYLRHVVRELPGDDMEFGFPFEPDTPGQRVENTAIHKFWLDLEKPFHLHASLHGMMMAAGPWFLLEKEWINKSQLMQNLCRNEVEKMNYKLHDVDRKGEKGFSRIGNGFCTRPDSVSMREYFNSQNDPVMAAKFFPSSMEAIRNIGGDALTIVSEMPLFILPDLPKQMDWPDEIWNKWSNRLKEWQKRLKYSNDEDDNILKEIQSSGIIPMPVADQMHLQWHFICAAIKQIESI